MEHLSNKEVERANLRRQLAGSLSSSLLTVLGIVLGPALGLLVVVITSPKLNSSIGPMMLMIFFTCVVFASVFEIIREDVTLWVWIPDFRDTTITFILGIATVYLSLSITMGVQWWLFGIGLMALLRVVGLRYTKYRADAEPENHMTMELCGFSAAYETHLRQGTRIGLIGAALFFVFALLAFLDILHYVNSLWHLLLAAAAWVVILLWLATQIIITIKFWKAVCAGAGGTPHKRLYRRD
jgi:hypothetical protein